MTDHASFAGIPRVPAPQNDYNRSYLPGSPERAALKARLKQMAGEKADIPLIIGGKEIRTGQLQQAVMPHNHAHVLADWHMAEPDHVADAIAAAQAAKARVGQLGVARARGRVPACGGDAEHDLAARR